MASAALSGCTAPDVSKAGEPLPVTLRMANGYSSLSYEPPVEAFVEDVHRRSGGQLRIDVINDWGDDEPDFEQRVVASVAAGEVDLAWTGTRIFDTLGVHAFEALTAPFLVDSYPLENAVLRSALPGRMLPVLDQLGVRGLAVVPGGLRRPVAAKHSLLGRVDWQGITFETFRSAAQAATVRALGAIPSDAVFKGLDSGLSTGAIDGFEKNLLTYSINELQTTAPHVTANVTLWPETTVLLADRNLLAKLTSQQAAWVRESAAQAATESIRLLDVEQSLVAEQCNRGTRFGTASPADLEALQAAVQPVYARLEKDPFTASAIAQIRELARSLPTPAQLQVPAACRDVS